MLLLRGARAKWLRSLVGVGQPVARPRPSKSRLIAPVRPLDCVIRLEFHGPQPSGKNHQGRTGSGAAFGSKSFVAWRREWGQQFTAQTGAWRSYFPIQQPVVVWATYTPSDERTRDVPGLEDAVWHFLEWVGCVKNDGWLREEVWRRTATCPGAGGLILELFPTHWDWTCARQVPGGVPASSQNE